MRMYDISPLQAISYPLQWRHNERDGVSNHQPYDWLPNRLCKGTSKKTSKLRVTGLCAGNSPETGEFLDKRASNAEYVSIRWRDYVNSKGDLATWKRLRCPQRMQRTLLVKSDILQGSSRLCNCLSSRCSVPWIDHLYAGHLLEI